MNKLIIMYFLKSLFILIGTTMYNNDTLLVLKITSLAESNFYRGLFTCSYYSPKKLITWNIFLNVWKKEFLVIITLIVI